MNRSVAQVFRPAGSSDFRVARGGGLESSPNPQPGKAALRHHVHRAILSSVLVFTLAAGVVRAQTDPMPPDLSTPVVTIYATDPSATEEGPTTGTFTVHRAGATNLEVLVFYQLGGTAQNGIDYVTLPGTVNIAAGATAAEIVVTPIDDMLIEGNESVIARIVPSPIVGPLPTYRIGWPSNAVVTIADNDRVETNVPPRVEIASPSDGATFPAPATVFLAALASDVDGYVATIEFFEGTNSLGITTNNPLVLSPVNPFQLTWSNVPPGAYTLRAKATDDDGAMSWSQPVRIFVGEEVRQPVVNIFATDPFATEIPEVPPGQERPQLYDPAIFTVTRTGPTNIDLPVFYHVGGTASNGVDYHALSGMLVIPAGAAAARIEVSPIDDQLVEGKESVVITIEAPACIAIFPAPPDCYLVGPNNRAEAVILDDDQPTNNIPPSVRITAPPSESVFRSPARILIRAVTVDPDGYANSVEFFANSNKLGEVTILFIQAPPPGQPIYFEFDWQNVPAGEYVLTARTRDQQGVTGTSAPVVVRVSETNLPPEIRITSPADGAVLLPGRVELIADTRDWDGSVERVEFFEGTNSLGVASLRGILTSVGTIWPPVIIPGNYILIWSNVPPGKYLVTAKATDNEGAMGVSAPIHITVTTNLPPPTNAWPTVSIVARDPIAVEGTNYWFDTAPWWDGWTRWSVNRGGTNTATFVVRRTDGTNNPLTVYYSVSGTASNGVDYEALPGAVTIPAGQRAARIEIIPRDDQIVEGVESVVITLEPPVFVIPTGTDGTSLLPGTTVTFFPPGYAIGFPRRAAALIVDNDRPRPRCFKLPDGGFHACLSGTNGFCYRLEVSTNCADWFPVCTNVVTDGAVHFVDPDAAESPARFYRAVPEPEWLGEE
jgi:hypothetical protein